MSDLEFQSHMTRNLAFLKVEIRQIQNNQLVILEKLEAIQSHLDDRPPNNTNSSVNELDDISFQLTV